MPAQHWSGRKLIDAFSTLWGGWLIEDLQTNKKIYFLGDTGYSE